MLEFLTKGGIYKRKEIWFFNNEKLNLTSNNLFYHSLIPPPFKVINLVKTQTSAIDLKKNEESIFSEFKSNYRNEIRRAYEEQVKYKLIKEISLPFLTNYLKSYKDFEIDKGLSGNISFSRIKSFLEKGNLFISTSSFGATDLTYHSYLTDTSLKKVILLYSHHNLSFQNSQLRGFANKMHHWEDIKYFKQNGFEEYDFGGVDFEKAANIAKFKTGFGGSIIKRYHFQKCSLFFNILSLLYGFVKK